MEREQEQGCPQGPVEMSGGVQSRAVQGGLGAEGEGKPLESLRTRSHCQSEPWAGLEHPGNQAGAALQVPTPTPRCQEGAAGGRGVLRLRLHRAQVSPVSPSHTGDWGGMSSNPKSQRASLMLAPLGTLIQTLHTGRCHFPVQNRTGLCLQS